MSDCYQTPLKRNKRLNLSATDENVSITQITPAANAHWPITRRIKRAIEYVED